MCATTTYFMLLALMLTKVVAQTTRNFCDECTCVGSVDGLIICDQYLPNQNVLLNAAKEGNYTLILRADFNSYFLNQKVIDSLFFDVQLEGYKGKKIWKILKTTILPKSVIHKATTPPIPTTLTTAVGTSPTPSVITTQVSKSTTQSIQLSIHHTTEESTEGISDTSTTSTINKTERVSHGWQPSLLPTNQTPSEDGVTTQQPTRHIPTQAGTEYVMQLGISEFHFLDRNQEIILMATCVFLGLWSIVATLCIARVRRTRRLGFRNPIYTGPFESYSALAREDELLEMQALQEAVPKQGSQDTSQKESPLADSVNASLIAETEEVVIEAASSSVV